MLAISPATINATSALPWQRPFTVLSFGLYMPYRGLLAAGYLCALLNTLRILSLRARPFPFQLLNNSQSTQTYRTNFISCGCFCCSAIFLLGCGNSNGTEDVEDVAIICFVGYNTPYSLSVFVHPLFHPA